MLFAPGIEVLLIGTSATALMVVLAVLANRPSPKRFTVFLHALILGVYLPLLALGINELDGVLSATSGWFAIVFTAVISIMSHAQFITARQLISARQEIARNVAKTSLPSPASRGGLVSAQVLVNTSVAEYRRAVVKAEAQGKDFAYIQRRLAPYLHKDEALHYIATQRFGAGNPEMEAYVAAHQSRRAAFFSALGAGVRYRELFPRSAIVRYVATGTHSDEMWPLPVSTIIELLDNWREVLLRYHNYYVGISDHALPIKYHVIDAECVILHEPVGKGDDIRLNSLFIYGRDVASIAVKDFDLVWGLIDPEWRDRERIARWISEELVPLANRRLP